MGPLTDPGFRVFQPSREAVYLERPNRFVAIVLLDGKRVEAHCANPGRMRELLVPGRRVLLEEATRPDRRLRWTLAAAEYSGKVIPLISSRSNRAAESLVIPRLHPGRKAVPERTLGSSRIDWYLPSDTGNPQDDTWIEVKACTLVEHGRAMFPDAPSTRAVKHLRELSAVPGRGEVIITVMNPDARVFSANPHTDPDFACALNEAVSSGVTIHAVSMACNTDGVLTVENPAVPVDLSAGILAAGDSGAAVKIWKDSSESFNVSVETVSPGLGKKMRSRRCPPGTPAGCRLASSYAIYGDPVSLGDLENSLTAFSGTANPADSDGFRKVLLEYRHSRVFSP